MKYALLLYGDESVDANMSEAEMGELIAAYGVFQEKAAKRVEMVGGEALLPTQTATSVRVRGGKPLRTDGPFAETKEQLGGFYLIDAKDLDEAVEIASMIPAALDGTVEIRPIMTFD